MSTNKHSHRTGTTQMDNTQPKPVILAVDDDPANLQVLRDILQDDYRLLFAKTGERALELAVHMRPQLILLDVVMPGLDGHAVCRALKVNPGTADIPVVFVTAACEVDDEVRCFEAGAVDFIAKPVRAPIVRARVRTQLALVRGAALKESRLRAVECLGRAAEYKDNETGQHVARMSCYAHALARAAGMEGERAEDLRHAAPMHDVGKIGIPDEVLLKPGKLDAREWEVMRRHPEIGASIIGRHDDPMLSMAREIALSHHEKYDGSGYPNGLAGEGIPLAARIVAIVDVFDALMSARPYKPAWQLDDALDYLDEQRGAHFDPALVDLFLDLQPGRGELAFAAH
jgi:putative two-component system response regulator